MFRAFLAPLSLFGKRGDGKKQRGASRWSGTFRAFLAPVLLRHAPLSGSRTQNGGWLDTFLFRSPTKLRGFMREDRRKAGRRDPFLGRTDKPIWLVYL